MGIIETIQQNPQNPFYNIAMSSMKSCQANLDVGDFESAMQEVDFIHNFPLGFEDTKKWNEGYFYRAELPDFLDHLSASSKIDRMKLLIKDLSILQDRLANKSVLSNKRKLKTRKAWTS